MENLLVHGVEVPHNVINMPGDGGCLFHSLSFAIYDTIVLGYEVRMQVVNHVIENWDRFKFFTSDQDGDNYPTKEAFQADMSRRTTYGTMCELEAAGELFPFRFEVYRNGVLLDSVGNGEVRRLRFSGDLFNGHFDMYVQTCSTEMENLLVDGAEVPHNVINMPGDGGCLFHSLSFAIYDTIVLGYEVRMQVVNHVIENWDRFKFFTSDQDGDNYPTMEAFQADMSRRTTYGTMCELEAAGEIFPFRFEVYRNGVLLDSVGNGEVRRLRFSGDLFNGHFDLYVQTSPTALELSLPHSQFDSSTSSCTSHRDHTSQEPSPVSMMPEKKRRSRFTAATRKKQLTLAAETYAKTHPEGMKLANAKYLITHSNMQREAVARYKAKNPIVQREAVTRYKAKNPIVQKEAVTRYKAKNPIVQREAEARYKSKNPIVQREAVARCSLKPWTNKLNSGFSYNSEISYESCKILALGACDIVCQWCKAKKWKEETPGLCCCSGKVQLPAFQQLPEPLNSLLANLHPQSRHFLNNIRKYNGCFQMTSFGAKEVNEGNFMPTFKVQGQVYHRVGSLLPAPQKEPMFMQIYFVGEDQRETEIRCNIFPDVKPGLVSQLQKMLHEHNVYVRDFKAAIDSVPKNNEEFKVVIHADKKPVGDHKGRYNKPSTSEVALVIVGQEFENRDVVLNSRDNKLTRINETHRAYDALQYPLLFCRGDDGYSISIPQVDPTTKASLNKTVSAASFYSYRIMEDSHLHLCSSLLNQFLVDMYAKVETERLKFIRNNQAKLRADNYIHLQDAVTRRDANMTELGQMVILPSSFTGGPRYMHERTQDAMTYVRHYGRPDLFITFTCNPKWRDITDALQPNQKSHDRHDIVGRVFHLKVKKMMELLTKGRIFGNVRCFIYSVEWQKRGLPHIHILLWLETRILGQQIDNVIRAEIPDPESDPCLYEIVKANMIHGPCGNLNRNSPCMSNGNCSKRYPRPLIRETQTGDDGYPQYRRRSPADGGFTVEVNGFIADNRWVVPYNPVLSRSLQAHINIEFCNSVKSIKYICKYVNKGSDQATFTVQDKDEIFLYQTGRYISSSEAIWRILGFSIHERYPPVVHLTVHLENGQRVYFTPDNVMAKISDPPKTTLIGFFLLCEADNFAKTLLYNEVPRYYTWKGGNFSRRKRGKLVEEWPGVRMEHVLGRVYTVHPNNSECYYLRMLLHEIRGPTSFTALRTIQGIVYPTYQSACKALGLLEDDDHWDKTLEEAALSDSPFKMRELFMIMLLFCQVSDPLALWMKHRDSFSEDQKRQLERANPEHDVNLMQDTIYNMCLILLEDMVGSMGGQVLKCYGLPEPTSSTGIHNSSKEYMREVAYDVDSLEKTVRDNEPNLTDDQRKVYGAVMESVASGDGKVFFLDAPGGTGKTFLINLLLAKIRSEKNIAVAAASSGIAATLLQGGRTAHAAFKLPLNLNQTESPMCSISKQSGLGRVFRECDLIVWDECTMAHKGGIEALNRTLQDIRSSDKLMGGVTVLLAGDFRQTLPVVPRGTRADEIKACLKSSVLWPSIEILCLERNMRVHLTGDAKAAEFSELLLRLGDGKLPENDGKIDLPQSLCQIVDDISSLTIKIYPEIKNLRDKPLSWLRERAILTPKNDIALEINNMLLSSFDAEERTYASVDSVVEVEDTVHYPVEFLQTLNPPGLPPHCLTLKVGVPIMLLRNLNPPKLCNGTRLQVKALCRNVIEATIFTGCGEGETVFIPRIPLVPSDYPFQFKRLQFPVRMCLAMTVNKAQGQSLKEAGVDLREDCFSHGQLYVACSRVSSPKNLVILQPDGKTANIVYKEVLQRK